MNRLLNLYTNAHALRHGIASPLQMGPLWSAIGCKSPQQLAVPSRAVSIDAFQINLGTQGGWTGAHPQMIDLFRPHLERFRHANTLTDGKIKLPKHAIPFRVNTDTFLRAIAKDHEGVEQASYRKFGDEARQLSDILDANPADVPGYLREHGKLATALGTLCFDELPSVTAERWNANTARLYNLAVVHGKRLVLPELYYNPEGGSVSDLTQRLAELDDAALARVALFYDIYPDMLTEAGIHAASAFQEGGELYPRLLQAFERNIMETYYSMERRQRLVKGCKSLLDGCRSSPFRIVRSLRPGYLYRELIGGYDCRRRDSGTFDEFLDSISLLAGVRERTMKRYPGGYFFYPRDYGETDLHILGFGLSTFQDGILATIEHAIPMESSLKYAVAAAGQYYEGITEFAFMNEGTFLFDKLSRDMISSGRRVALYAYSDTEDARATVAKLLATGVEIYFNLCSGYEYDDLEGIYEDNSGLWSYIGSHFLGMYRAASGSEVIPGVLDLGDSATFLDDESNSMARKEAFYIGILSADLLDTEGYFEKIVRSSRMAEDAAVTYASIPGISLKVMKLWREAWKTPSQQLLTWLESTMKRAEGIRDQFMGKRIRLV